MVSKSYSWTCPYCQRVATLKNDNISGDVHKFHNYNKLGLLGLYTFVEVCPNEECQEFTIQGSLYRLDINSDFDGDPILRWQLKPQSSAKPFPSYIPAPILQDYGEACLIRDLSPKASATLSRRCLQGIIRDFWGISKPRLIDEINELQGKVDGTTWGAIDAVRGIGNIGAHMEKDINIIIDVDPEEAGLLLRLIEVLLEEWYIRRHERNEHMQKVIATAQNKSVSKSSGKTP